MLHALAPGDQRQKHRRVRPDTDGYMPGANSCGHMGDIVSLGLVILDY